MAYSALASNIWTDNFTMFELTEIMGQKDDKKFAELLNRMREGKHTKHDIANLNRRVLKVKQKEKIIVRIFRIYVLQMHQ